MMFSHAGPLIHVWRRTFGLEENKIITFETLLLQEEYDALFGGVGTNIEKTKYMLLSHQQNAGQNHDIKIANRCYENVEQSRYLGAIK
jgi:hypothetical protein